MGNNYLYNLGDSWAWGYNDNFDIPFKNTYADIVAENFGLEKVTCCKPGWAMGNTVEKFLQSVFPKMSEGDCVLVTVPPDTRICLAGIPNLLDGGRRTITVYSDEPVWKETVKRCGANPYQFELTLNKDLMLIASLCQYKNVKYAFQHNYSEFTFDPRWDIKLITDHYIDTNSSMLDWLGIATDTYIGGSIQDQLDNNTDGINITVQTPEHEDMLTASVHPNIKGHKHLGEILTHKLERIWNMQRTNGIN